MTPQPRTMKWVVPITLAVILVVASLIAWFAKLYVQGQQCCEPLPDKFLRKTTVPQEAVALWLQEVVWQSEMSGASEVYFTRVSGLPDMLRQFFPHPTPSSLIVPSYGLTSFRNIMDLSDARLLLENERKRLETEGRRNKGLNDQMHAIIEALRFLERTGGRQR